MDHNKLLADVSYNITGNGIPVGGDQGVSNLEKLISTFIGILTFVAVIYFVVQVILAGYAFISSQGDEKKMLEARSRLTNGILGLVVVVLALGLGSLIAHLLGANNLFDLNATLNLLVLPH